MGFPRRATCSLRTANVEIAHKASRRRPPLFQGHLLARCSDVRHDGSFFFWANGALPKRSQPFDVSAYILESLRLAMLSAFFDDEMRGLVGIQAEGRPVEPLRGVRPFCWPLLAHGVDHGLPGGGSCSCAGFRAASATRPAWRCWLGRGHRGPGGPKFIVLYRWEGAPSGAWQTARGSVSPRSHSSLSNPNSTHIQLMQV